MTPLLDHIQEPEAVKALSAEELEQLAGEIRAEIINTVSKNGGHLASNLGLVELTLALLVVFEFPRDKVVFDVGHQTYAWKLLTGRKARFCSLRQQGGLSGFPKRTESVYDCFNTGHSSTSISAAVGLSRAMARSNRDGHAIAVIGDGALTGGMAFEALNDAGQSKENLIVILNDNQMSIGRNVGGLSRHLENLRLSTSYLHLRTRLEHMLDRIPIIGRPILLLTQRIKQLAKMLVKRQGIFFEQLGFRYYGPVDGHDLPQLIHHLKAIGGLRGPVLFHVLTQKGKGYSFAESSPDLYHGVAPFVVENGVGFELDLNQRQAAASFSAVFGEQMVSLARHNPALCAISAAMTSGTGLSGFQQAYPHRFFDVGIAEQHAMTFAAGLAAGGLRPVVALYSTFLQRAYDQLLHDICLQQLPVVVAIDRAGIVGEDGETHQGLYDLSLLLPLPNLEVFSPSDYQSLRRLLTYACQAQGPVAIRYPRGTSWRAEEGPPQTLGDDFSDVHRIKTVRQGSQITLAALGPLVGPALEAARCLAKAGIDAEVLSITCAKPLDLDTLTASCARTGHLVFLEEALITGGLGQLAASQLLQAVPGLHVRLLGVETGYLPQGKRQQLLKQCGLDAPSICRSAQALLGHASGCSPADDPV